MKPALRPAPLPPQDEPHPGLESRAADDDHLAVRTWLRLLACTTQIEQDIRSRLRERFGTTLARFDYLAQLERHPEGLRMSALSRCLMVTGGNVTGLTTQLEADGLVERQADPQDGRSWRVVLTARGREDFAAMAVEHEQWIRALFEGLPLPEQQQLYDLLGRLRTRPPRSA
ncbi:MAG TPA: MarR family transcriptional regulator [Burkholderiaceae bacterium]|nr:MarR family transcriptional regulator [Burkholderiaceae bacterium]HMX11202.1 MarR family transcriptional regulator [Burkholderiaceae bacterium]HMZ02868.1 MarR family transcriptional regulator [Burkholderiaceae bacterium]HNB43961.1 MarR family transcriptional regulator [Burkholderiaceae bacterium]HNG81814.1 MarR family transcriptional regulator [Burkholderiaceae bacterium]